MSMELKRHNIIIITFGAGILSNLWLLTNVSYAVPLSPTSQLPAVKITSPHKSQQIPVGSNILVSGISSPPPGVLHTSCTVSVLLNDAKPYQKTVALGHEGKGTLHQIIRRFLIWFYTRNIKAYQTSSNIVNSNHIMKVLLIQNLMF